MKTIGSLSLWNQPLMPMGSFISSFIKTIGSFMKTMGSLVSGISDGAGGVVILMWTKLEPAGIIITKLDAR
jgi:hypothetical protein